jgi:hypothetical protein
MQNENFEWGKEALQTANDLAELTEHSGIPGIGLLGKFVQKFYDYYLKQRFEEFCQTAQVDSSLIAKIQENEDYSNCFYSILETVRRTHSKLGLTALALLYKDYWNDEKILIPAMRSFAEISDQVLLGFIELYESIPEDKNHINLYLEKDGQDVFHPLYQEAVELINRNIFLHSSHASMHASAPIQGIRWNHTDLYYRYCVKARDLV